MQKKLSELCTILPGISLRKKPTELIDELAPRLLSISSLKGDRIDLSPEHHTPIEAAHNIDKYTLHPDDIAFSTRGAVNKASLMPKSENTYIVPAQIFIIRPNNTLITPLYLTHYLNSTVAKRFFLKKQRGTVIKNLTKKSLSDLPIHLPTIEEQQRIIAFKGLIQQEKKLQDQIHELRIKLYEQTIQPPTTHR